MGFSASVTAYLVFVAQGRRLSRWLVAAASGEKSLGLQLIGQILR